MEKLKFLTPEQARQIRTEFGSPLYVYDESTLRRNAEATLAFPATFGLTVRYAMKACPNAAILQLFHDLGLQIDASSGYEVQRAIRAGIPPSHISLSAQELPADLGELIDRGMDVNATSMAQIRRMAEHTSTLGLRFNPGLGSGGTNRTNVGGPASSFGIWHEQLSEVRALLREKKLRVNRLHSHIGSGSDPAVWQRVAHLNFELVRQFPEVSILNLGGGFKIGRMADEASTDLQEIGAPVREAFELFAAETGRELHLEIEPGTFLVANACAVLATVQDKVSTGEAGYTFLRLNAGMTEILRPSLYGAQHPIIIVPAEDRAAGETECMVVGHCCESGDILTPAPGDPEGLRPRHMLEAEIGDLCIIEGAGAYCASMAAKNYNSYPEAAEVMLDALGRARLIRKRQNLDQILANEQ